MSASLHSSTSNSRLKYLVTLQTNGIVIYDGTFAVSVYIFPYVYETRANHIVLIRLEYITCLLNTEISFNDQVDPK